MSIPQPPTPVIRPGWYPDNITPGQERWWDGTAWTAAVHRTPNPTWDWAPAYTRAFWPGLNTPARVARILGLTSIGLAVLAIILSALAPLVAAPLAVLVILGGLTTAVLGIVALSRSRRQGALGLGIWSLIIGVVLCPSLGALAFLLSSLVGLSDGPALG